MSIDSNDGFAAVVAELQQGVGDSEQLSGAFLMYLPVAGATVATVGSVMGTETLSATGDVARRLDEWQFDLAEGPCWDAVSQAKPVFETNFPQNGGARWPSLFSAAREAPIGAIFAFPLTVGALQIGAVDLYTRVPSVLNAEQQGRALALAEAIGQRVVRDALASQDSGLTADTPFSRRLVHQATGLVLAQVDVSPEDATLLIRTHAHSSGMSMMEVSERLLAGRLSYARVDGRIEVQS